MAHKRVKHGESVVLLLELLLEDGIRDVLHLEDAGVLVDQRFLDSQVHLAVVAAAIIFEFESLAH